MTRERTISIDSHVPCGTRCASSWRAAFPAKRLCLLNAAAESCPDVPSLSTHSIAAKTSGTTQRLALNRTVSQHGSRARIVLLYRSLVLSCFMHSNHGENPSSCTCLKDPRCGVHYSCWRLVTLQLQMHINPGLLASLTHNPSPPPCPPNPCAIF